MFLFYLILILAYTLPTTSNTKSTISVHHRVALLKYQLEKDLAKKQQNNHREQVTQKSRDDYYVYEEESLSRITPIMEKDEKKQDNKFKFKKLVTIPQTTRKMTFDTDTLLTALLLQMNNMTKKITRTKHNNHKQTKVSKSKTSQVSDIFYRRTYDNLKKHEEWVHCQDLITPYFEGYKKDIKQITRIDAHHTTVVRLIQLLKDSFSSNLNFDDVKSILYQISNLQIRLFQWEDTALRLLVEALVYEPTKKTYSFRTIKYGIKTMFSLWGLDMRNTTQLLLDSKLFRPPCVVITPLEGSTKQPKPVQFSTTKAYKVSCIPKSSEDCAS